MTRMFLIAATQPTSESPRGECARLDSCVRFASRSPISVGYLAAGHDNRQGLTWDPKRGAAM